MTNEQKLNYYIENLNQKINFYAEKVDTLQEEIVYCVNGGGKRIRPLLLLSMCEEIDIEDTMPFACSIEFIHNYSLVHDDLPAMDNDDYRRNKLTCHKRFGEAKAILTGDELLNNACQIIIDKCIERPYLLPAAKKIFDASSCMVKGQVLDMEYNIKNVSAKCLEKIHLNKTCALIRASLEAGVVLSFATKNFSEEKNIDCAPQNNFLDFISQLGNKVGLAFQIKDDILDGGTENDKPSYFNFYGKEKSCIMLDNLVARIYSDVKKLDGYDFFKYLVDLIIQRKN